MSDQITQKRTRKDDQCLEQDANLLAPQDPLKRLLSKTPATAQPEVEAGRRAREQNVIGEIGEKPFMGTQEQYEQAKFQHQLEAKTPVLRAWDMVHNVLGAMAGVGKGGEPVAPEGSRAAGTEYHDLPRHK
jgi:hypothetical protein